MRTVSRDEMIDLLNRVRLAAVRRLPRVPRYVRLDGNADRARSRTDSHPALSVYSGVGMVEGQDQRTRRTQHVYVFR